MFTVMCSVIFTVKANEMCTSICSELSTLSGFPIQQNPKSLNPSKNVAKPVLAINDLKPSVGLFGLADWPGHDMIVNHKYMANSKVF